MQTFISCTVLGIIISILGILNAMGNISSLHWYHRHRVNESDKKPFGKLVGAGTLIIGGALILFGVMSLFFEKTGTPLYSLIATALLVVGIILGVAISFYAMIKYNKGIF